MYRDRSRQFEFRLKMNPVFVPLFSDELDDPRYYQVYGGRGSGKSYIVSHAAVEMSYSEYGHRILFLRQVMTTSEDSTIADVEEAITQRGAWGDFKKKGTTLTNKITGSTITFKGIKSSGANTAKLKSLSNVTIVIFEEAEEVSSFAEFSKIDESVRLLGKPLKIIMVYNPTSALTSWVHEKWFMQGYPKPERDVKNGGDTVYMHSTYLDNIENLHPSTVKMYDDLKESDPIYYHQVILAEWTLDVSSRIYSGWGECDSMEKIGDVWYGLDFGYGGKDHTAIVRINYVDDTYYINEVFSQPELKISEMLKLMREIPYNAPIYADSAMPLLITEIRNSGYTQIRKCRKMKIDVGIKKAQDKRVVLVGGNKENPNLWFAYRTFAYTQSGKLPHEPDILAALRYGLNSRRPIKSFAGGNTTPRRRVGGFL